jgi:hypothetical protein
VRQTDLGCVACCAAVILRMDGFPASDSLRWPEAGISFVCPPVPVLRNEEQIAAGVGGSSAPIPAAQVRSADARKRTLLSDMMMAGLGGKLPVLFGERSPDCGHPCQGASGRILNNSAITPILPPESCHGEGSDSDILVSRAVVTNSRNSLILSLGLAVDV